MSLGEDIKADITCLLKEVGEAITLILVEPGSGPEPIATETTLTLRGVLQNHVRRWSLWETQDGDRLVTLSPEGLTRTPRRGDVVLLAGERWPVINVRIRAVQGVAVAYTLQLRR